jgi:hypothetical protein
VETTPSRLRLGRMSRARRSQTERVGERVSIGAPRERPAVGTISRGTAHRLSGNKVADTIVSGA